MLPILDEFAIIPEHQFGFRRGHGTPEQCHRIINEILSAFGSKKYCTATFLDVQQEFDRVWRNGLLYKIKKCLPAPYFLLFKSYLTNRQFYMQQKKLILALSLYKSWSPTRKRLRTCLIHPVHDRYAGNKYLHCGNIRG